MGMMAEAFRRFLVGSKRNFAEAEGRFPMFVLRQEAKFFVVDVIEIPIRPAYVISRQNQTEAHRSDIRSLLEHEVHQ